MFPTYSHDDFTITSTGIELRLKISTIDAVVIFKGLSFIVDLPSSLFHNNTEGQCGKLHANNDCLHHLNSPVLNVNIHSFVLTFSFPKGLCDNNRTNDCRLPNGQIHPSCSEMASKWQIKDKSKPVCDKPSPPNPSPGPTPTTKPCKPDLCELLLSE